MSTNPPPIIFKNRKLLTPILFLVLISYSYSEEFCHIDSKCGPDLLSSKDRYLLYDINPPEGFNLRRDVYMRFAILAHKLKQSKDETLNNFKLVLPPWSRLFHWSYNPEPEQIPWGVFFDLKSLKSFAPVIEMYEFFTAINKTYSVVIDEVYVLQHFKDMFETGNFNERMKLDDCVENYQLNYFFYKNITSKGVKCLSYHGPAPKLSEFLSKTEARIILFHHAEVALHEMFGNKLYWQCRRSMRFSGNLREIASTFQRKFLNSTWLPMEDEKPRRDAQGGPYLGVHLRRRDFVRGRPHQSPSLASVAAQINNLLGKLNLSVVFIATDASEEEYRELVGRIPHRTLRYAPSKDIRDEFGDGGVAIIEQIICSHARYFVGTYESTFSFRIQEEREILGFPVKSTFNSFCGEGGDCPQPSVWKIVY